MKKLKIFIPENRLNFSKKLIKNKDFSKGIKTEILIKNSQEQIPIIKQVFSKRGVIVIGEEEFNFDINTFGNIIFKIKTKNLDFDIYGIFSKNFSNKLEDIYILLKDLGFKIIFINDNIHPLSNEKLQEIFNEINKQIKNLSIEKKNNISSQEKDILSQEERKKLVKFIDEIISDAENTIQKTLTAFPSQTKELKKLIDELQKIKRSTNIEKINILMEQIINLSEKLELEYIKKEKLQQHLKTQEDALTDLEILLEHEKYEKSLKIKNLKNIKKNFSELVYAYLGKPFVSIKLLFKDFIKKSKHPNKYATIILDIIKFSIINIFFFINLYLLYLIYTQNISGDFKYLIYISITFGIAIIIFGIFNLTIKKLSILKLALILTGIFIITYLLNLIIDFYFAF